MSHNNIKSKTSRSLIGTSHVTDGWKLSFILNSKCYDVIRSVWFKFSDLLDFDFGKIIGWSFDCRNFSSWTVPRITDPIRIRDVSNLLFNQCGNFPWWTRIWLIHITHNESYITHCPNCPYLLINSMWEQACIQPTVHESSDANGGKITEADARKYGVLYLKYDS